MDQIRVAVSTVIRSVQDKILVLRRTDNGKWNFPGGKVESGENLEEAAAREVLEETGLDLKPTRIVHVFSNATDDGGTFIFVMFRATTAYIDVQLNEEHSEYKWVTHQALADQISKNGLPRLVAFAKSERSEIEGIWHRDVTEYDWYPGEWARIGKAIPCQAK